MVDFLEEKKFEQHSMMLKSSKIWIWVTNHNEKKTNKHISLKKIFVLEFCSKYCGFIWKYGFHVLILKNLTHWKSNGIIQVIYSGSGTRALKSLFRSRPLRFTNVLQIDAHPSCECDKMIFGVPTLLSYFSGMNGSRIIFLN